MIEKGRNEMEPETTASLSRIDHEAPKHECPICHHTCYLPKRKQDRRTGQIGRRPVSAQKAYATLMQHANQAQPMPAEELARRLGMKNISLPTLIYRARSAGYDIRYEPARGYWARKLDKNEERNPLAK